MRKTWDEKYEEWRKRSGWRVHTGVGARYAYHAGRKHQREALNGEYVKIRKYYKEVDDWQDDLTEKFGVLTRERNEYKARCEALLREDKRKDEKHMAQHIIYRQKIAECESLRYSRDCIQIQNGSLKNQIRILRETIVDLESKDPWWKFWKVDW